MLFGGDIMDVPRVARLREEIRKEASDIIQRRMKDPRIGFTTVTDVEVSADLRHVKIFVSVLGDEEARARTVEGLERAKGFVRTELGRRIRLRHTPEIQFAYDPSLERGARLMRLLSELDTRGDGVPQQGEQQREPGQDGHDAGPRAHEEEHGDR